MLVNQMKKEQKKDLFMLYLFLAITFVFLAIVIYVQIIGFSNFEKLIEDFENSFISAIIEFVEGN